MYPWEYLNSPEKQNFHVAQPCLHTLMQARLSANHSARTIFSTLYLPQCCSYGITTHRIELDI